MKDSTPREASLIQVALWFSIQNVVSTHGLGGLIGLATDFLLKDRLGLAPESMARYGAVLALPSYAAFLFGYARDRWGVKVGGDRNLAVLGAIGIISAYVFLASAEPSYSRLVGAMLAATVASSVFNAAFGGAIVRFTTERGVTDRWSGFSLALGTLTSALSGVTAGWAAAHIAYRPLLRLSALLGIAYIGLLFLAPRGAFRPPLSQEERAGGGSIVAAFVALVKSRAFVAAIGLAFAYNFGPASGSSFFYFMSDRQGVGPELFGQHYAAFNLAPLPVALLYGAFARRTNIRNRMMIGMSLLFCGSFLYFALQYKAYFVPLGALFGLMNAVYLAAGTDLLLGAIPKGSEGMGFAIFGTFATLIGQVSNLTGAHVYQRYGYQACIWLTLPAATLGLFLVALVPRDAPEAAQA